MITYFKKKKHKPKKKHLKIKILTTLLKSIDTFVTVATTSSPVTLSLTRIDPLMIPISTASACALSIGNKRIFEIFMQNYKK